MNYKIELFVLSETYFLRELLRHLEFQEIHGSEIFMVCPNFSGFREKGHPV